MVSTNPRILLMMTCVLAASMLAGCGDDEESTGGGGDDMVVEDGPQLGTLGMVAAALGATVGLVLAARP